MGLIDLTSETLRCIALPSTGRPWPEKGQKRHKGTSMLAGHVAPKVNFGNPFDKFCVIVRGIVPYVIRGREVDCYLTTLLELFGFCSRRWGEKLVTQGE